MDGVQERAAVLDATASRTLSALMRLPGAHRAALALAEVGGRRLRFTSSERAGDAVRWCHIDAYDDVPLTAVLRSGSTVAGTLRELSHRFPEFVDRQAGTPTVALVATPVCDDDGPIGGLVLYLDDARPLGARLRNAVAEVADSATVELRRAGPASGAAPLPAGESVPRDAVVATVEVHGASEVRVARRRLGDLLRERAVDEGTIDSAVICLSELVTNAVMHAGSPSYVRMSIDGDVLRVAVQDGGGRRTFPDVADHHEPLRVHGRGLQIVEALSTRWGSGHHGDGTTAWFLLRLGPRGA
jgi:anti-sigma regulatory factor (Ser/Thr protein kinase)